MLRINRECEQKLGHRVGETAQAVDHGVIRMNIAEMVRVGRVRIAHQLQSQHPVQPAELTPEVRLEAGRLSDP